METTFSYTFTDFHAQMIADYEACEDLTAKYEMEKEIRLAEIAHIEQTIMPKLPQLIFQELMPIYTEQKAKLDAIFEQNDLMRAQGISFEKRNKELKLDTFEAREKWLTSFPRSPEEVIIFPVDRWLPEPFGYSKIKEQGLGNFIKNNINFMYENRSNTY